MGEIYSSKSVIVKETNNMNPKEPELSNRDKSVMIFTIGMVIVTCVGLYIKILFF